MKSVWQWGKSRASPVKRMGLLPWNCQITAWAFYREIVKLQHGPSAVKLWNHRMDRLPWNRQIIAWANCREIIKLQQGPSGVKSSNCSMGHLPWNREITGWTASHEIVKSQHEPIAMKMSNCSMCLLPWNRQITAWIIWREIIKLQHGFDSENILGDVLLVIRAKILFVWIKDIFSMMCFWWVAPKYSLFGFRTYSPWCALDESRQKVIFWL